MKNQIIYVFAALLVLPCLAFSTPRELCELKGGSYIQGNSPMIGGCWCYNSRHEQKLINPLYDRCGPTSPRGIDVTVADAPSMHDIPEGFRWITSEEEQKTQAESASGAGAMTRRQKSQKVYARPHVKIRAIFPFGGSTSGGTPVEIHFTLVSMTEDWITGKRDSSTYELPRIVSDPGPEISVLFGDLKATVLELKQLSLHDSQHLTNYVHSSWENCDSGENVLLVVAPPNPRSGSVDVSVNFKRIPFSGVIPKGYCYAEHPEAWFVPKRFYVGKLLRLNPPQREPGELPWLKNGGPGPRPPGMLNWDWREPEVTHEYKVPLSFLQQVDGDASDDKMMTEYSAEEEEGFCSFHADPTPVLRRKDGQPVIALAPSALHLIFEQMGRPAGFPRQLVRHWGENFQMFFPANLPDDEGVLEGARVCFFDLNGQPGPWVDAVVDSSPAGYTVYFSPDMLGEVSRAAIRLHKAGKWRQASCGFMKLRPDIRIQPGYGPEQIIHLNGLFCPK